VKKILFTMSLIALLAALFIGCASPPPPPPPPEPEKEETKLDEPLAKKPDLIDHKNYKWGTQPPEWVTMDVEEIESMDKYEASYVFKFESPRAQNLQGAQLWLDNFQAASQIAQQVSLRVQSKFAGAAAGDMDMLETYMEQVVKTLAEATITGFKKVDDYWVQMRYYKPDGSVDEDAFTYLALYTVPEEILDEMVRNALDNTGEKPDTEEEKTARDRVKEAFDEGF
jgi:hypothetical protein